MEEIEVVKYITTIKFGVVELRQDAQGLWRDANGVVFALRRDTGSLDPIDQCGIAPFVLPVGVAPPILTAACVAHDYMYESPAYQLFHLRSEADEYLMRLIQDNVKESFWRRMARPFYWISRTFGRGAWENEKTND